MADDADVESRAGRLAAARKRASERAAARREAENRLQQSGWHGGGVYGRGRTHQSKCDCRHFLDGERLLMRARGPLDCASESILAARKANAFIELNYATLFL